MVFFAENNECVLLVEKELYPSDVLESCFYWYGDRFDVSISIQDEVHYKVILQPQKQEFDFDLLKSSVIRDLNDFKLRSRIAKETANIRDLLIAKAFSYEEELTPSTSVSDPVGFDPKLIGKS